MRAVWYDRQGAADEVLVCGELPMPNAGHGEVRVKLEASGVNPSDTYRRRGPPAMEYPRVITNSDGAGIMTTPAFSTTTPSDLLIAFVSYDGPSNAPQTATVSGASVTWSLLMRSN